MSGTTWLATLNDVLRLHLVDSKFMIRHMQPPQCTLHVSTIVYSVIIGFLLHPVSLYLLFLAESQGVGACLLWSSSGQAGYSRTGR